MHDVIIIGGSFAGLAAALQLGRARRDVLVLDTNLPRNRYATHSHGFLTNDGVPPREILRRARDQLAAYATARILDGEAIGANAVADGFEVELSGGERRQARRLILAHGMTDDLSLFPGLEDCWGKTVFSCPYCHGFEVSDRRLGHVLRHGDALMLAHLYREWSDNLTLFTNGAAVDTPVLDQLIDEGVSIVEDTVMALEHKDGMLQSVETAAGPVPIDAVFMHPPTKFSTQLGVELGCETKDGALGPFLAIDNLQQTTVPGVFAAGDIARPAPSISYAVADGVFAGVSSHRSLIT